MSLNEPRSRRTVLKLSGVAAVPALLAGCADGGPGEEDDEDDPANGEDDEDNGEAIEPGEIELEGHTAGWEGVAPEEIADEENPTLTLEEGAEYEITWENADGAEHNIELRDDGGSVVDDYETDLMGEEGETQTLEFEASDEMVEYVCQPHEGTMVGDIEVQ